MKVRCTITRREGKVNRVSRGKTPDVVLVLATDERVVGFELRKAAFDDLDRKTVDWYWTATIAREELAE